MRELNILPLDILDIKDYHTFQVYFLPLHHKDPFDRLLIAQAQIENLYMMTVDHQFKRYNVKILNGYD